MDKVIKNLINGGALPNALRDNLPNVPIDICAIGNQGTQFLRVGRDYNIENVGSVNILEYNLPPEELAGEILLSDNHSGLGAILFLAQKSKINFLNDLDIENIDVVKQGKQKLGFIPIYGEKVIPKTPTSLNIAPKNNQREYKTPNTGSNWRAAARL